MYSIKRHIEPILARRAKQSKSILLTGPRQVGKSTLFRHLFSDVNQVTFDDDLLLAQATEDIGLFLLNNPCPLMIDEVQKCPSIFNRVKIILDNTEKKIYRLREQGYTQGEVAKMLGYSGNSAVSKRLKTMRAKFKDVTGI